MHNLNIQSTGTLKLQVLPNPNDGSFVVKFNLNKVSETTFSIYSLNGEIKDRIILTNLTVGENSFRKKVESLNLGGTYFLTIETPYEKAIQKIIITP